MLVVLFGTWVGPSPVSVGRPGIHAVERAGDSLGRGPHRLWKLDVELVLELQSVRKLATVERRVRRCAHLEIRGFHEEVTEQRPVRSSEVITRAAFGRQHRVRECGLELAVGADQRG